MGVGTKGGVRWDGSRGQIGGQGVGPDRSRGQIGGPEVLPWEYHQSWMRYQIVDGIQDSGWNTRQWMVYQIVGMAYQMGDGIPDMGLHPIWYPIHCLVPHPPV